MLAAVPSSVAISLVVACGYLLGSIPFAATVARRHGVPDLREVGDRNPGYWNARRQIGDRFAVPILVLDTSKGAAAAALGLVTAAPSEWWLAYLAGGAAMVGHAWPLFAGFRGGRSVLTFVGAAAVCAPLPALVAVAVFVATWAGTRNFAWGARAGIVIFPFAQILIEGPNRTALTGVLMALIGLRFLQANSAHSA